MKDASTGDWLSGQVAASHRYLQDCLLPLLKIHKIPRAEEDIAQALFALNRISSAIGDTKAKLKPPAATVKKARKP